MSTDSRPAQGERDLLTLDRADIPLVFMYHAVADVDHDPNALAVGPEQFAAQMDWLARRGLRGVSMRTLVAALRAGDTRKLVGITFDDGYLSVLENALPVLKRHQFSATVFVIADRLGATNEWDADTPWPLLSAAQVGELAEAGLEIGSHSATHIRLAGTDADQLATEVSGSRQRLREVTESAIEGFAYPYGSMDAAARRAVRDAGYDYACAVSAPRDALGLMALPRLYVGQRDGAARMTAKRLLFRRHVTSQ
jgi:peptidoglycan/xylan/chitin deacetylase (PgdA/CDA1 family)